MRLLVTRPIDDSERLAERLRAMGHEAVVAPLMIVDIQGGPPPELARAQAILATSANGVRAFARRSPLRDIAFYAVGPQTAEVARTAGFAHVVSANGDAVALCELVTAKLNPANGALFHAAGAETTGRLRQRLEAHGFTVQTETLYEARAVDALPSPAAEALAHDTLGGIMVFSPRSAAILTALVTAANLAAHCGRLEAYCISAAAAEPLAPLGLRRLAVAGAPNEDAILALVDGNPVA